jgi:ABC-type nickel/cobalt efflux system permease component RcnA
MTDFAQLLQQGAGQAWLFVPTAIALGALHGLEPGHSKTLMASFIVAVRGTGAQAALLGLSAALSHSAVVWALAAAALMYGNALIADRAEPYIMLASGAIVVAMAGLMLRRARRAADSAHGHGHSHDHGHGHSHGRTHDHDFGRRFAGGRATTGQVVAFGLTGGLLPCPAAVTVLLICLNLKQAVLGAGMVAAFSTGLALTLVAVGLAAAWGVRRAERRFAALPEALIGWLPYLSALLVAAVGVALFATGAARL